MALVSVSGACSRAGKTSLAVTLLRELPASLRRAAVKFTTTEDVFQRCPRGAPCVVCDIDVPFRIVEDPAVLREAGTDTARLAEAGSERVMWAISRASAVAQAWAAVVRRIAGMDMVIMEGSTIVAQARPGYRFFVVHPWLSPERWKPGSDALIQAADVVVVNRPRADSRAASPEVMAEVLRHRKAADVVVADVTRPLGEWAPGAHARLAADLVTA